jgi:hypothetical protein
MADSHAESIISGSYSTHLHRQQGDPDVQEIEKLTTVKYSECLFSYKLFCEHFRRRNSQECAILGKVVIRCFYCNTGGHDKLASI